MAKKEKACKNCKMIYEGNSCPSCQSTDNVEGFKGKVTIVDPENSEIAKQLGVKGKGVYAIRLR
ncbi:MAG: transcription elongation factor subunit Spt4 [Nanoarchaeota archaeon]